MCYIVRDGVHYLQGGIGRLNVKPGHTLQVDVKTPIGNHGLVDCEVLAVEELQDGTNIVTVDKLTDMEPLQFEVAKVKGAVRRIDKTVVGICKYRLPRML